jgi:hypothetical protein
MNRGESFSPFIFFFKFFFKGRGKVRGAIALLKRDALLKNLVTGI